MTTPKQQSQQQRSALKISPKGNSNGGSNSGRKQDRRTKSFFVVGLQLIVVVSTVSSIYFSVRVSTLSSTTSVSPSATTIVLPSTTSYQNIGINDGHDPGSGIRSVVKSSSLKAASHTSTDADASLSMSRNMNDKAKIKTRVKTSDSAVSVPSKQIEPVVIDDPILQSPAKQPVRVRILLFQSPDENPGFGFRNLDTLDNGNTTSTSSSSTSANWKQQISDELLNICLDGFERSAYFEVLEPTIVGQPPPPPLSSESSSTNFTATTTTTTTTTTISYLQETQPVVWVIDVRRLFVVKAKYIFDPLIELLYNTRRWQIEELVHRKQQHGKQESLPSIHIVFMDYRDRWSRSLCKFRTNMSMDNITLPTTESSSSTTSSTTSPIMTPIETLRYLVGRNNVRHVRRQIVQGRFWEESAAAGAEIDTKGRRKSNRPSGNINPGVVVPKAASQSLDRCYTTNIPTSALIESSSLVSNENAYLHVPYTVRSDYVDAVIQTYEQYLPRRDDHHRQKDLRLLPPDTYRPIDASHLFNPYSTEKKAELRKAVSLALLELEQQQQQQQRKQNTSKNFTVIADAVSTAANVGRTSIQSRYLEVLLSSKVVVVAQRDEWEDHYRLFEAIIGGALVMTDFMWSLPPGYKDGVNIVVYKDMGDLKRKIIHYVDPRNEPKRLSIAHSGWKLAMEHHRSFHWMERLFFGKALTTTK